MSNWSPYNPDFNPPPSIPKGYPYALNPNLPNTNPMFPNMSMNSGGYNTGYPPNAPSAGLNPSPAGLSSYPDLPSYPSAGSSPYGMPGQSPYPTSGSSPYPSMGSVPPSSAGPNLYPSSGTSPYPPSLSPFPPGSSPYPPVSSNASGSSPYAPGASPYPPGLSNTSGSSPYPPGASLYPPGSSNTSGSSPYPPGASPYPPGSSNTSGSSPYPSGQSPYPSGSSPYSSGTPAYPSGPSPYSADTNSPSTGNAYSQYSNNQNNQGYPSGHNQRNMADYVTGEGTVRPYPNFDPKVDAEVLRKAMKGFGTDEKAIINVLASRSNSQRVYISIAFKQLYGKDLIDDLKSELSGNFETVILGLMMPLNDYLASELHEAMSGMGTDEDVLIEILCSRTNQEIWAINEAYNRLYGTSLEEDLKNDTSGHFQRLLVSSCTGARSEAPADGMRAKETAEAIYEAGAGQWGTDESVFNSILVAESFQQLAHTFYEYQKLTGSTVVQAIESELSGDVKQGMLAIAKCVENRPFYFAEKLYKAMKVGFGTDDNTLIRIIVSRCEIDMVQIKAEYERNYEKPLVNAIQGDTSGDYKKILVALIEGS